VQQQHQWTVTGLGDVQPDAVREDVSVSPGTGDPDDQLSPGWLSAATVSRADSIVRAGALIARTLR